MTPEERTAGRIAAVRKQMEKANLPAMLVSQITNVGWLTGFSGTNGFVVLTRTDAHFATDSRYVEQANAQVHGFERHLLPTSAPEEVTAVLAKAGEAKIGFEADHITVGLFESYGQKLPASIELVSTRRLVDDLRLIKDPEEIERILDACRIADRCFAINPR